MKKIIITVVVILIFAIIAIYCKFILGLASQMANPKVSTLEKEMSWEKEHKLWGDMMTMRKKII